MIRLAAGAESLSYEVQTEVAAEKVKILKLDGIQKDSVSKDLKWSQLSDLNRGHMLYESIALPLS